MNKAENQLIKDVEILVALLEGVPKYQIVVKTFASLPDTPRAELEKIMCEKCLEDEVICREDLADLSLLQKKIHLTGDQQIATPAGKANLLTFTARCLSSQSFLHFGYRELDDKQKLVEEKHKYNLKSVDNKIMQREFVVASPEQQEAIASLPTSPGKPHLVLEGAAGTGKTLVAVQVANNLMDSLAATAEAGKGPVLVVSAVNQDENHPLLNFFGQNASDAHEKLCIDWGDLQKKFNGSKSFKTLGTLADGLAEQFNLRQVVLLLDEIQDGDEVGFLADIPISDT